jgi:hypothetical protein
MVRTSLVVLWLCDNSGARVTHLEVARRTPTLSTAPIAAPAIDD